MAHDIFGVGEWCALLTSFFFVVFFFFIVIAANITYHFVIREHEIKMD